MGEDFEKETMNGSSLKEQGYNRLWKGTSGEAAQGGRKSLRLRELRGSQVPREGWALVKARQENNTQGKGHTSTAICCAYFPTKGSPLPEAGCLQLSQIQLVSHTLTFGNTALFRSRVDESGFRCPP